MIYEMDPVWFQIELITPLERLTKLKCRHHTVNHGWRTHARFNEGSIFVMDDLIEFCVEQIALDGEQGTYIYFLFSWLLCLWFCLSNLISLLPGLGSWCLGTNSDRLWDFALQFLSTTQHNVAPSNPLDQPFKSRLWRLLLRHAEVIVKVGEQIISPHRASSLPSSKENGEVELSSPSADYS